MWLQLIFLLQLGYLALRIILKAGQKDGGKYVWFGYLALISAIVFSIFVLNLVLFHTYLIIKNTTTWEHLSWNKISYLHDWKREFGSPFDLGIKENIKLVFWNDLQKDDFFLWKMPYWHPVLPQPAD